MAEVEYIGVGKPEKPTLKNWAKKTFTFEGNEAAWREKHANELEEIKAINETLSPMDRAKALEKIEKNIRTSAKIRVAGNYIGSTLASILVGYVGFRIGKRIRS